MNPNSKLSAIIREFCPDLPPYEEVYRDIHRHPELGLNESRTASIAAAHLRAAGYEVITQVGGHGVVGVMYNGPGATILLRADMDALPILEKTGLAYASKVYAIDQDGREKPVMHACGHDMHVTCLMAASSLLSFAKTRWGGTVICVFQPDEEHGTGAQAMVDDGLYMKIPRPDIVLGQHVSSIKTGVVALRPGVSMAAADSFKITIFGRGGHGAQPQDCIDPILLASYIIVRLQAIVSREIAPADVVSMTCGSIHGGETENVIPEQVELKINIRSFDSAVREKVIAAMKRIVKAECEASGVPRDPVIEATTHYPVTINDAKSTEEVKKSFSRYFGPEDTWEAKIHTASEDFSNLATAIGAPYVFWNFGGVDTATWDEAQKRKDPSLILQGHSALYAPTIEPTLQTGTEALALAALTFLTIK